MKRGINILNGKGFILRPIKMSDAQTFFEAETDKKSKKGFMSYPKNINEVRKSIKKQLKENKKKKPLSETFTIEVNNKPAGWINIHDLNKEYHEHKGEIGYCLHPEFRGKGLTTKALKILIKYIFKKYNLKRLSATCRTFNKASAKTLEKTGFKLEGILRKNKCKEGKYLDDMIWAIVK